MQNEIEYLFVYGTLTSNFNNKTTSYLKKNSTIVGEGFFHGKLYDLGDYPGAVYDDTSKLKVNGTIFHVNNISEVLNKLDEYEGVGVKYEMPNEYKREVIKIISENEIIKCWVYLYNRETTWLPIIISGNYLEHTNSSVK